MGTVWVYDDTSFTIDAQDVNQNGRIDSLYVGWDGGPLAPVNLDNVRHAFRTGGWHQVRAYAVDNDGNHSDTLRDSVFVDPGTPLVSLDSLDTASSCVFVNDYRKYYLHAFDPNGKVRKICINWNGGTTATDSMSVDAQSVTSVYFQHKYPITQPGPKQVKIWAVDEDTIQSAIFTLAVNVRLGAPVIDSIAPDTVWVRDVNLFTVHASDTNGHADSFEIDWNNDGAYDDRNGSGVFTHAFDTSTTGMRSVLAHVMDNDSVWSTRALSVLVRLGRPMVKEGTNSDSIQWVRGAVYDTMFYVYKGSGNTWVIVDTSDTNGFMQRFDWDRGNDGSWDYTTTQPALYQFFNLNAASLVSVRGKDDDSVNSNKLPFYVFPDEPPPVPTVTSDPITGGRKISWSGKDAKDGNSTQYKIIALKSPDGNPVTPSETADIVQDWQAGSLFASGSPYDDFSFTFTPNGGTGKYFYQVISRDARGSISRSSMSSFNF